MTRSGFVALFVLGALASCRDRAPEPDPIPDKAVAPAPSLPPSTAKVVDGQFSAMGTSITFKIWTDREGAARAAMQDALAEIKRIEAMMTTWSDASEVSKINAAAGGDRGVARDVVRGVLVELPEALEPVEGDVEDALRRVVDRARAVEHVDELG